MIRSNMRIAILASTQEKGDAALLKMEKRFLNSVMQGRIVFWVKVVGKSNDSIPESDDTNVWIDKPSEGDEPWK